MGKVFDGYSNCRVIEEEHNGIDITHVPVLPRGSNAVSRLISYHHYPLSAKRYVNGLEKEFDVVFSNQSSPVMMVEPALEYAKKWGKRVVMYCMDLWPASLCVGGIKKESPIYKYYWKVSKRIYENVDIILITSRSFKKYFVTEFGIPENKIDYLPQYATTQFENLPKQSNVKKETTDFVFAGNVGAAQNLEIILKAAKIIADERVTDHGKEIKFHIIGNGQSLGYLQNYAERESITNVIFHGRKPPEDMPGYYMMADAMLVTMIPDKLVSLTLPAKVQSYMAAGKPILASADGEIASVIKESMCGFCAKADDEKALKDRIEDFINLQNREQLGENARKYYLDNFSAGLVMDKLETILRENCR